MGNPLQPIWTWFEFGLPQLCLVDYEQVNPKFSFSVAKQTLAHVAHLWTYLSCYSLFGWQTSAGDRRSVAVGSGRGAVPPACSYSAFRSASAGLCHGITSGVDAAQTIHHCSWGFAGNLSQQKVNRKSINSATKPSFWVFLLTFHSRFTEPSKPFILRGKKLPFQ